MSRKAPAHFEKYTAEWAETAIDTADSVVRRAATEYGSARPAAAPLHKNTLAANHTECGLMCHAISVPGILAGNIGRPGGRHSARAISMPSLGSISALWFA